MVPSMDLQDDSIQIEIKILKLLVIVVNTKNTLQTLSAKASQYGCRGEIAYQNFANSDVVNIETSRFWENGHCGTNNRGRAFSGNVTSI